MKFVSITHGLRQCHQSFRKWVDIKYLNHTITPRRKFWFLMSWVGPSVITKISHVRLRVYKSNGTPPHFDCTDNKCKSPGIGHISNLEIREKTFIQNENIKQRMWPPTHLSQLDMTYLNTSLIWHTWCTVPKVDLGCGMTPIPQHKL